MNEYSLSSYLFNVNSHKNLDTSSISQADRDCQQCQVFRAKRIENVRLAIISDGYGDFTDEIVGDILAAGGEDA